MSNDGDGPIVVFTPDTAREIGQKIAIDGLESPLLRQAVDIWNTGRGAKAFPTRDQMGPQEMRAFLRNVSLFRVLDGGADFEWRVMGDAAVQAYGRSYQGMNTGELNDVQPGMGDVIKRVCGTVVRERGPLAFRGRLLKGKDSALYQETVMLPLGPDESIVESILVIGTYTPQPLKAE
jgi:hypothetical protein